MKHTIVFDNTDNHWDNALPLGNGVFGAMPYFEKGTLNIPTNHYEVYYNIAQNVLPKDMLAASPVCDTPGASHKKRLARAIANLPPEGEPYASYRPERAAVDDLESTTPAFDSSYPKTGDMRFDFSDSLSGGDHTLKLYVNDAKTVLSLKKNGHTATVQTLVARDDCVINRVTQSNRSLLKSVTLLLTPQRSLEMPNVKYEQKDDHTFLYTVTRTLRQKTFKFCGIMRLVGATGEINIKKHSAEVMITDAKDEFFVLFSVFTQFKYKNLPDDGISAVDGLDIDKMLESHKIYWDEFFDRSSVTLPDKFLERVYVINQYALDCSSGRGGVMKHHACGLNGLWDVRHPSLWGSMWYWDVNIQAAFAGVFSSNRPQLARVFSDGLLSYVELAKKSAHDIHNMSGIAGDYPYNFYYSVWPWCAQYLWYLYEYSLDKEYLKNEAFPVFVGLCEFYCQLFEYDENRGYYSVFPDISPEQGPLTHDSIITVASVKYLFKFTLEAAKILGVNFDCQKKCIEIMNNMAPYPVSGDGMYGVHFRDSHDAPDNMWLRHPSMLMPVFPIGEFDLDNDKNMWNIVSNTVDFLEDNAEIGIFGGSWLAAAAARLGRGQTALRLIYERGIDHMLRTNGLTAEKTDRFVNYCLTIRQPLYYPCMMEFTGQMLAATNELLLRSVGGVITVFPALPDGSPEYGRSIRHGIAHQQHHNLYADYPAWRDVRFDRLLAKGAFELSASLKDGELEFIKIFSKRGGVARIASPYLNGDFRVLGADFKFENGVFELDTDAGKTYIIAKSDDVNTQKPTDEYDEQILSHLTYTKRNIYIGENAEARYSMAVDRELRDWYFGNLRIPNQTMYKLDFTNNTQKRYSDVMPRQTNCAEKRPVEGMGFLTVDDKNLQFTDFQGFGFVGDVKITEREGPDALRCDFAEGNRDAEFIIEVPRGQYELFVVSGDVSEDSFTCLAAEGGLAPRCELTKKGEYQCKTIPVIVEDGENIRLKVSTREGFSWKINYIILNGIKCY